MKCPKCGNEVGPNEAFCGQCGTPNMPPAHPTEMVNTPSPRSGYSNTFNTNRPGTQSPTGSYNGNGAQSGVLPPTVPYGQGVPSPSPSSSLLSGQAPVQPQSPSPSWPSVPHQPTSFYQDATEAIPTVPDSTGGQNYPGGYGQQNFAGTPVQGGYPGAAGTGQFGQQAPQMPPGQPYQPGPYGGTSYPQTPGFSSDANFRGGSKIIPPEKQNNTALIIACVFLVIALLAAIAFGTLYLTRGHSPKAAATPTVAPTAAPSPTAIPSPTPTVAPTPTTAPTPTVAPTPAPDANFSWCSTACTNNGFLVEFPNGWNQGQTADGTGVQFVNPAQPDEYAAFKTPGATTSSASTLVNNDLQANFASKPGYTVTTPASASTTTTIGGETWTYEVVTYQNAEQNNAVEQVAVYATVHQGKAYIIELQAPQNLYATVNTQYFEVMLNRFQFQQTTS